MWLKYNELHYLALANLAIVIFLYLDHCGPSQTEYSEYSRIQAQAFLRSSMETIFLHPFKIMSRFLNIQKIAASHRTCTPVHITQNEKKKNTICLIFVSDV